uniref:Uncharacterized protein n=1 Tax=Arundo donax TaxID=35708 RepID=A0A0A8Y325_ARUDO
MAVDAGARRRRLDGRRVCTAM